jgi:hypothetical protein
MADESGAPGAVDAREHALRRGLLALGVSQLGLGMWMAASPRTFFHLAGFGVRNDHYVRDVSTFYVALGAVLLAAVPSEPGESRSWRSRRWSTGCTS